MTITSESTEAAPELIQEEKRRYFATQQALNSALWSVCDVLRRSHCSSALQYIPELTWLLFLRILDEREQQESETTGQTAQSSLAPPYAWKDWAAPGCRKRLEWQGTAPGTIFHFVNQELLPYLKSFADRPEATSRQRIISEVVSGMEKTQIGSENDLLEVLDDIHAIQFDAIDPTHVFALSQVYEGLLLRLSDKAADGGQFFTPREVVRTMVKVIAPTVGETVYDPCCGTGGFLAQACEFMQSNLKKGDAEQQRILKHETFYGREKENLVYPLALANLVMHGIEEPHIWHGNTLTGTEVCGGLFQQDQKRFDVILTNPPFGGKEGAETRHNFAFPTGATQILFLQHVIASLKPGGRCGIVLDEGVLFRTNETAFVQTKKMLLAQCDLWCVVSLPDGIFTSAGALVKTNLLFFTKGSRTERVWYYDLSHIKVGKKSPMTGEKFNQFLQLLPDRADGEWSWSVTRDQIERKGYDLKAVNPHRASTAELRAPQELLTAINEKNAELQSLLQRMLAR